jgi:hypothetical protein
VMFLILFLMLFFGTCWGTFQELWKLREHHEDLLKNWWKHFGNMNIEKNQN